MLCSKCTIVRVDSHKRACTNERDENRNRLRAFHFVHTAFNTELICELHSFGQSFANSHSVWFTDLSSKRGKKSEFLAKTRVSIEFIEEASSTKDVLTIPLTVFLFFCFFFIVHCRLETCPPMSSQPKGQMEEWHRATLTVPTTVKTIDANGKEVPIPPPRRKRSSQEAQALEKPKSGFKELFGNNSISRRSSCDSTVLAERAASAEKEKFEAQQRRTQSAAALMPSEALTKLNSIVESRPMVTIPTSTSMASSSSTPSPSDRPGLQRKY